MPGIHEVFANKEELNLGVEKFIQEHILPKNASSLRFAARAARTNLNAIISRKLPQVEKLYLEELMETADANESIQAFLEMRKPGWVNR